MTRVFHTAFRKPLIVLALTSCIAVLPSGFAAAQVRTNASGTPNAAAASSAVQQDSQRTTAVILVKNALLAVNQGNLTGNYTVLRDLASPGFREKNSAADLAAIFQTIRQQKIDLSPIVVLDPALNQPRVTGDGELILEGYFAAQQVRINFQLSFLKAKSAGWMIHGISINAVPDPTAVASNVGR
jgi:hypothetical protein